MMKGGLQSPFGHGPERFRSGRQEAEVVHRPSVDHNSVLPRAMQTIISRATIAEECISSIKFGSGEIQESLS